MPADLVDKLIAAVAGPVIAFLLASVLGQRLAAWWSERQKRRELELALAGSFYASYGEFCAIWKEWNWSCSEVAGQVDELIRRKATLHERACRTEGTIESVLLKISAERRLSVEDAVNLGNLRQAFQVLRECIQEGKPVSYGYSSDSNYLEFKRLSIYLGNLLARRGDHLPTPAEAFSSFCEITDNRHELPWARVVRD